MSDYIGREEAIKSIAQYLEDNDAGVERERLERLEAAIKDALHRFNKEYDAPNEVVARDMLAEIGEDDVVKVVRCKDCKYRKSMPNVCYGECIYSASMVSDNDYCSNGEKK